MPVIISKKARKTLDKIDARREAEGLKAPPKPAAPPVAHPTTLDPNKSLIAALWAMKGRPDSTLMFRRKKDGKMYRVLDFSPATSLATLALREDLEGRIKLDGGQQNAFQTKVTSKTEELYEPYWR